MVTSQPTPLRYLSAADVLAAMPDLEERLALAERTMTALVAEAQLPPKIAIHPRPDGIVPPCDAGPPAGRRSRWRRGSRRGEMGCRLPGESRARAAGDQRDRGAQRPHDRHAHGHPRRRADHRPAHGRRVRRGDPDGSRRPSPAGRPGPRSSARASRAGATSPVLGRFLPGVQLSVFDRHAERAEALAPRPRRPPGSAGRRSPPTRSRRSPGPTSSSPRPRSGRSAR